MALTPDNKLKLAAGVYGDFVTNDEVANATNKNLGYKPDLGTMTHEQWINKLLSGNDTTIREALNAVDIVPAEQDNAIAALPTEREVALAVYKRLKEDFALLHPPAGGASQHDY